ncbi:MAG TPA: cobyrinate a,c-diamide synthase [Lichenihabitans sp.]|jgi:cobyrinic acid a,c-diamide synthase|nr:cobyrinate a,c-diamide synthase [Lichenihabitans sp.]
MTAGLLVAAPRSGSGKTVVTLGLMRAFRHRGLVVAGLKNGPDYIDPAFHAAATGRPSANIDTWAMSPALAASLAAQARIGADLVIGEGSMGLFDGVPALPGRSGSSADMAALLGLPAVLVHDCSGQSQSAAAQLAGCAAYDPRLRIAGVILNRIGSERHRRLVWEAVETAGLRVFGALPRDAALSLPERHLGLVQAGETADLDTKLDGFAEIVAHHVDLDAILAAGQGVLTGPLGTVPGPALPPPGKKIAVARDAAFSFLYPHVLDGWRQAGADLQFFSPLADEPPPEAADACWLPGGYPELHGARLAAASRFMAGLRDLARTRPVHGECGGYMVLGRSLADAAGTVYPMAGLLSVATSFERRKMNLGYRDARLLADSCLGPAGTRLRGHEFHYAAVVDPGEDPPFAEVVDAYGSAPVPAGSRRGNVTGSFFHALAESSSKTINDC